MAVREGPLWVEGSGWGRLAGKISSSVLDILSLKGLSGTQIVMPKRWFGLQVFSLEEHLGENVCF